MVIYDLGLVSELPETIPDIALGRFPEFRPGAAHPVGLLNSWEYRSYWNIPIAFRDRICHGYRREETAAHNGYSSVNGVPRCNTCRKPPFWSLHYCVSCGVLFIKDFSDSRFCNLYPHCFDCLPKLSWAYCPDHTPAFLVPIFQIRTDPTEFAPIGLNPRKFTDEELADAFDDPELNG